MTTAVITPRLAVSWHRRVWTLPNVVTCCYVMLAGALLARHGLWRDEAQAFLIARDSHSVGELLWNLRFEGHPPLWHFILFLVTRVTARPEAMQWLHLAMAGTSVYLVARFAPFPRVAKILFPFGYYPLFEYGILARNYQLLLLLSVLICLVWQRGARRRFASVTLGVLIALLCLSHAFGIILGAGFGMMLWVDALVGRDERGRMAAATWRFGAGLLIAVAGAALAVQVVIPKPGGTYAEGWRTDLDGDHVRGTLTALCNAYLPLSPWREHFWNQSLFQDERTAAIWGVVLAGAALLCVIRSWRATVFLLISDLGLLAFFHVKFFGFWRHHGILYVALIAALWIAWSGQPRTAREGSGWVRRVMSWTWWWIPRGLFVALLGVHVYAAAVPVYYCWKYEFSPARDAAALIRGALKPGDILVSGNQIITAPVAAYLPGEKFYFPVNDRWGTFTLWDSTPWRDASAWEILAFTMQQHRPVVVVRCWDRGGILGAKRLGRFDEGIADFEEYAVYRIEPRVAETRASDNDSLHR